MMLQAVRRDHLVRVHCHIHAAEDPRPAEKWTGDFGCFFDRYKASPSSVLRQLLWAVTSTGCFGVEGPGAWSEHGDFAELA